MYAKLLQLLSDSLQPHGLQLAVSFVHGILQARVLEWVAMSSCRGVSIYTPLNLQQFLIFKVSVLSDACMFLFIIFLIVALTLNHVFPWILQWFFDVIFNLLDMKITSPVFLSFWFSWHEFIFSHLNYPMLNVYASYAAYS